jgi:hypothetical protein
MRVLIGAVCLGFLLIPNSGSAEAIGERSVAIILDASGSMNAPLDAARTRMDAAKVAVTSIIGALPDTTRIALWAYGHQSGTDKRDCRDIEQLVPTGAATTVRADTARRVSQIAARGYTPITASLTQAATELSKEEAPSHVIALVSDGKETCPGDPCAAAKALANSNAKLVVHTVGLGVDAATRGQLQCIATVTGGIYADAGNIDELNRALTKAVTAVKSGVAPVAAKPHAGHLVIRHSGGHRVLDAETGVERGFVASGGDNGVHLPPGIYNVRFPNEALWRGVLIKEGETTTLAPGVLRLTPTFNNHKVLDPETEQEFGYLPQREVREAVLIPGVYAVAFGSITALVDVKPDTVTTFEAGAVRIVDPLDKFLPLRTKSGVKVAEFYSTTPALVVPPGSYVIEFPGSPLDVEVKPGQTLDVRRP